MNKKGFTLVELIVSFILVTIVIVFFSKTIIVSVQKENKLLSLQEYTAFEATFLKAVGKETNSIKNKTVSESGTTVIITDTDTSQSKTLSFITSGENAISFNNTLYPLPNNTNFRLGDNGKYYHIYSVNSKKTIINIYVTHDGVNKTISIILNN